MDETIMSLSAMRGQIETDANPTLNERLSSPELRNLVERFVRRRVPEREVDDLVQTVFVDALSSKRPPDEDEALRKWLVGITRHKVADFHRRGGRVKLVELPEQLEGDAVAPHSAHEWADWAEKQAEDDPDAKRTLDWMAREGDGEKLAHIAEQERIPATQVRQRVSRMRRFMKRRWAAELAAVAAIVIIAIVAWRWLREPEPIANPQPDVVPVPETVPPVPPNIQRARQLRAEAEAECESEAWRNCLDKLREAAGLDPDGARDKKVSELEQRAQDALQPPPDPTETAPAPSASDSMKIGPAPESTRPAPKLEPSPKTVPSPKSTPPAPSPKPGPDKKSKKPPSSTSEGFSIPFDKKK
jgi:DNA-directed RNA polymerase specialized sigma24 family protein